MMDPELLGLLRGVDTPTVCNAIEVAEGKRGFDRFTRGTPLASAPDAPAMVGYARTARIRAAAAPSVPADAVRALRMEYYRYMAEAPAPSVAVVEDADGVDAVGAFWGEINATVHRAFGLSGALTNGLVRDLDDLPEEFPVVAGGTGPSHAFVHVVEFDTKVRVLGLDVTPGDLVHADRHGGVVIPPAVVPELGAAIRRLIETEKLVLEPARRPGFDFAAFEAAWSAFEKART